MPRNYGGDALARLAAAQMLHRLTLEFSIYPPQADPHNRLIIPTYTQSAQRTAQDGHAPTFETMAASVLRRAPNEEHLLEGCGTVDGGNLVPEPGFFWVAVAELKLSYHN